MPGDWLTAQELAGLPGMPQNARNVTLMGDRGELERRQRERGKGWEYSIASLPEPTRIHIADEQLRQAKREDAAARAGAVEGRKMAVARAIDHAAEMRSREQGLARLVTLPGPAQRRADAKLALLGALEQFGRRAALGPGKAIHAFCTRYNAGEIEIDDWVRETVRDIHPATVYRWKATLKAEGAAALGGHYEDRKATSKIDRQPELQRFVVAMLTDHPHTTATNILASCRARFSDSSVSLPSLRRLESWIAAWKSDNAQLHMAITNPDAWKNRHMVAFGSASEGIERLNQLWEADSTPADVMLLDGRHAVIGLIDVWPRRPKLLVSKTSKATAIATLVRRALLDWGVPERVKTDNGSDYTSHHITRVFRGLGVDHDLCDPFSAWQKPHIERFFRTFSHGLLELLPGYIGHNVAERSAIEARKSFADRLMTKGEVVEIKLTAAEFQQFCDRWVNDIYSHREHGESRSTPFQRAAAGGGELRTITDERALDVLLAEAPGDGMRVVGKKGIALDRIHYIAPELGDLVGERVHVRLDPEDVGRIYVFHGDAFVCIAEDPRRTGVSRQEVAAVARQRQKARVQEARRELRRAAKLEGTKEIADEILAAGAKDTASLTSFPARTTEHTSPGLTAAQAAADARQALEQPPELPLVDEAALARVSQLLRDEQRQDETAEDRFRRWIAMEAKEELSEFEAHWKRNYESTSEFRGRKLIYDDFGPSAFGVA